jgi:hypothetical protein
MAGGEDIPSGKRYAPKPSLAQFRASHIQENDALKALSLAISTMESDPSKHPVLLALTQSLVHIIHQMNDLKREMGSIQGRLSAVLKDNADARADFREGRY